MKNILIFSLIVLFALISGFYPKAGMIIGAISFGYAISDIIYRLSE